ncbi:MAG TPA: peptidoglycan-binding protein [Terriglobales bacterium]|nr:peptidoglycan-binding protein [Terriglobales bacterium]
MTGINIDTLRQVAPRVSGAKGAQQAKILQALGGVLADTLARFEIDNDLRRAHFLAQICHESDGFCTTVEYASGQAYEGRADLGNTRPGDGPRYKGRGLVQLTGRANYAQYGKLLGLNLVDNPELAADPATSLVIACEFWTLQRLNPLADQDDIEKITRRINGGLNGLADRLACLARAKAALAGQGVAATAGNSRPTLRRGDKGEQVAALQAILGAKGFALRADGDFGLATAAAVKDFQASRGLPADGVVGPRTWQMLGQVA